MLAALLLPLAAFNLEDESNVRIPRGADGKPLSTEERLRLVELKLGGSTNWAKDPTFGFRADHHAACRNQTKLCDDGSKVMNRNFAKCERGMFDHPVCLDDEPWQPLSPAGAAAAPCVVYDFGVRTNPHFGFAFANTLGCEVHAFDPSPISVQWYAEEKKKGTLPSNYHFHSYGAGGVDGHVWLQQYNWGQVSILRLPLRLQNCSGMPEDERVFKAKCKTSILRSKNFKLKVHTLGSIMRHLGHTKIDIVKVDVEGSEYAFLEDAIDTGALHGVQQLALEWHHFPFDPRYGSGSSPPVNALVSVLAALGLACFWVHSNEGWPGDDAVYAFANMHDVRYNLAGFRRVRSAPMRGQLTKPWRAGGAQQQQHAYRPM